MLQILSLQAFYTSSANPNWRYEKEIPVQTGINTQELVEGAKKLSGWIQSQVRD